MTITNTTCLTCLLDDNLCNCDSFDHDKKRGIEAMATKKKHPTKPKSNRLPGGDRLLFRRDAPIPQRVLSAADLWLDFFVEYTKLIDFDTYDEDGKAVGEIPAGKIMDRARELADAALSTYQDRWPEVEP